jgi:hypothetical protein
MIWGSMPLAIAASLRLGAGARNLRVQGRARHLRCASSERREPVDGAPEAYFYPQGHFDSFGQGEKGLAMVPRGASIDTEMAASC